MKLKFYTLDVFTTRRFSGNPLAVVLGRTLKAVRVGGSAVHIMSGEIKI